MNPLTLREVMILALEIDIQTPVAAAHAAATSDALEALKEYAQVISCARRAIAAIPTVPPVPEYAARLCPPPLPLVPTIDRLGARLRPFRPSPPVNADPPPRLGVSINGIDAEVPAANVEALMTHVPLAFWDGYRETLAFIRAARADGSLDRYLQARDGPPATAPATTDPPTIWYHADRSYSTDRVVQYRVTDEEDNLIQVFLESDGPTHTGDLVERSGVTNVARVVGDLQTKYGGRFAPAIRRPHAKGAGGYYIRVRRAV